MAPFRLYSVRINENNITTDNVTLISPRHSVGRQNEYSNYFLAIMERGRVDCFVALRNCLNKFIKIKIQQNFLVVKLILTLFPTK